MRTRTIIAGAAALLLAIGFTGTAEAQQCLGGSCSQGANVTIDIPQVLAIDLTGGDVTLQPTAAQIDAGAANNLAGGTLDYRGNVAHDVTAQLDTDLTSLSGVNYNLEVSVGGGGNADISDAASQTVVAGAPRGRNTGSIQYSLTGLDYTTDPGAQNLTVTYTVIASP